jgi:hypothetical protein
VGSRTKRLRKTQARELRLAANRLFARATKRAAKIDNCWDVHPTPERLVVAGWAMEAYAADHPNDDPTNKIPVEHWHLSLQLHPRERPERPGDWSQLGDLVHRFARLTGYDGPPLEPVRSLDAAPREPHHFVWHADASRIPPEVLRTVARAARILKAAEAQEGA